MIITYCPICRRIKIDAAEARQMAADFNTDEILERQDTSIMLEEAEEEEKLEILASLEMQTRVCVNINDDFQGEDWVKISDQEWGAIQTILNSPNLLYMVDNYADYPIVCPACRIMAEEQEKAEKN